MKRRSGPRRPRKVRLRTSRVLELAKFVGRLKVPHEIKDSSKVRSTTKLYCQEVICEPANEAVDDFGLGLDASCGSACCLGGWTTYLFGHERWLDDDGRIRETVLDPKTKLRVDALDEARGLLGLTERQAGQLFEASPYSDGPPTAKEAAATLRHLAKTGNVDWYAKTQRENPDDIDYGHGVEW